MAYALPFFIAGNNCMVAFKLSDYRHSCFISGWLQVSKLPVISRL